MVLTPLLDCLNPLAPTPQNSQTHSNNSSAFAGKLFEFDHYARLVLKGLNSFLFNSLPQKIKYFGTFILHDHNFHFYLITASRNNGNHVRLC